MELRIAATDLARNLGDALGKVRFRRDSFVIERNGVPVARLSPWPTDGDATVSEGLRAWAEHPSSDPTFADDLERVSSADTPATDPWA